MDVDGIFLLLELRHDLLGLEAQALAQRQGGAGSPWESLCSRRPTPRAQHRASSPEAHAGCSSTGRWTGYPGGFEQSFAQRSDVFHFVVGWNDHRKTLLRHGCERNYSDVILIARMIDSLILSYNPQITF